jgi:hypothetical protein
MNYRKFAVAISWSPGTEMEPPAGIPRLTGHDPANVVTNEARNRSKRLRLATAGLLANFRVLRTSPRNGVLRSSPESLEVRSGGPGSVGCPDG